MSKLVLVMSKAVLVISKPVLVISKPVFAIKNPVCPDPKIVFCGQTVLNVRRESKYKTKGDKLEFGISYDVLIGNECQDILRVVLTKQSQNSPQILGMNIFGV